MADESTQTLTYEPGLPAFLAQYFGPAASQLLGMAGGGGGADVGELQGVGQALMQYVQGLMGGPNATQQAGIDTLLGAADPAALRDAYRTSFSHITAPTLGNQAIAAGLSPGAATEAGATAGAQAGVDIAKLSQAAKLAAGQGQIGVGNSLIDAILRGMSGAGGIYSNAAQIQQQGQGQGLGALSSFIGSILGYRPQLSGTQTQIPFWPSNLQGVLGSIQTGSGLIQPAVQGAGNLYGFLAGGNPIPSGITGANPPIDMGAGGGFGGAFEWPA